MSYKRLPSDERRNTWFQHDGGVNRHWVMKEV
jgi:hypothetical protein